MAGQASLDLVQQFGVDPDDNGLERFLTATRRQNFLIPPAATVRSHWSSWPERRLNGPLLRSARATVGPTSATVVVPTFGAAHQQDAGGMLCSYWKTLYGSYFCLTLRSRSKLRPQ